MDSKRAAAALPSLPHSVACCWETSQGVLHNFSKMHDAAASEAACKRMQQKFHRLFTAEQVEQIRRETVMACAAVARAVHAMYPDGDPMGLGALDAATDIEALLENSHAKQG